MPRYVMLLNYTDKGVAEVKNSPKRADDFRALAKKHGATIETQLWTMGAYDGLVVLSVADEAEMAGLALGLSRLDYVRTTTLRAFDETEFKGVLGKIG